MVNTECISKELDTVKVEPNFSTDFIRNNLPARRSTWAEIDLNAIKYNFLKVKQIVGPKIAVLVPVKANAYGHGILEISSFLESIGVDYLGVGTTDEGVLLRNNGISVPIMMLGSVLNEEAESIICNNITQSIGDFELLRFFDRCAARLRKKAIVHLKIDTGMGRFGIWHKDGLDLVQEACNLKNIEVEGIFSHFSSADEDAEYSAKQLKRFTLLLNELNRRRINLKYKHIANSSAVIDLPDSYFNLVRPGIMVYGLCPILGKAIELKPAFSLKSRIVFIKEVDSQRAISYGAAYKTKKKTRIATVPIGYGDGLSRALSNKGKVIVRGKICPIVGRVCMDQIMIEIGALPEAKVGDEVVLIGSQNEENVTLDDLAELAGTIAYEVLCWFSNRVPRIYKNKFV